ncbi:UNVERIFIED_ORG: hypothetical protein M2438_001089 [Methylobacterium sp. SuP10 SLI 274]|nr:hypothetical protein [Methylorubrum extorquens]MDF9790594.1 hypothetical protein [Methylorubrum extorquens]MDF9862299.1 hypothetical protein [Methylorubrum pseudosasae]MDH6635914.1 hypothetical protein [Methylobacterium sp. SuP10 SLI 274]MDH6665087.1 hypothetical protein [Methylorubrum zatmanii]
MASLYSEAHRALQEEFGTTKLAVRLDEDWVHETIQPDEAAFIASRDMFFLSTVDPDGMPTVSYKGGPTGFVKVVDGSTLVFPGFDGNGMFYSMGNIAGQAKSPSDNVRQGLSGRNGGDSRRVLKPHLDVPCGPRPLAGSITVRAFDTKPT